MAYTSTTHHAVTLFNLTMETQHGADWRSTCRPHVIAAMADEVALGFGGMPETPTHADTNSAAIPTIWRFPDGSKVRTGDFGVLPEEAAAFAA
jgi:hypothetical protein